MGTTQANRYERAGDLVNVAILVASIVYLFIAIYYTLPGAVGVVDEYWKRDGFCIHNMEVPYWSSFDTCLYVDVICSAMIGIMYLYWKDLPGMEAASAIAPSVIAATLGHGAAHGAMAVKLRDGSYHLDSDEDVYAISGFPLWQLIVGCAIFWFPLLKGAIPEMSNLNLSILSAGAMYGGRFVKKELGFAYVQTIVNMSFHLSQLMLSKDEKNVRGYMIMPLTNVLPTVVAWTEFLFCDSFFRAMGGHMLYDASIVVSFMAYYYGSYRFSTKQSALKEKAA